MAFRVLYTKTKMLINLKSLLLELAMLWNFESKFRYIKLNKLTNGQIDMSWIPALFL